VPRLRIDADDHRVPDAEAAKPDRQPLWLAPGTVTTSRDG
jgi:hypothetical protein